MSKNTQLDKKLDRISTLPDEIFTVEYWRRCYDNVAVLLPKRGRLELLAKQDAFFDSIEGTKCYATVRDGEGSLERTRQVVIAATKHLKINDK